MQEINHFSISPHEDYEFLKKSFDSLSTKPDVTEIVFNISRYGKHKASIKWKEPVSEKFAVAAVEKYLSEPLDLVHFEKVIDDSFDSTMTWPVAREMFQYRGDVLTDAKFLEALERDKSGTSVYIITGS